MLGGFNLPIGHIIFKPVCMKYQDCLNHIYSSYMNVKSIIATKLDSEVRDVSIILSIAEQLDIIPDFKKVIKING